MLKKLLLWSSGGLGILLSLAVVWVLLNRTDAPDAQDQDLMVERLEIPDEANAYTSLKQAAALLTCPDDEQEPRLKARYLSDTWDGAFARDLVARNRRVLSLVTVALTAPQFQVPEYRITDGDLSVLFSGLKFARLLRLRAFMALSNHDQQAAIADVLRVVQLGHRIELAQGGVLLHMMVGQGIKRIGLQGLAEVIPRVRLTPAESKVLASTLSQYQTDPKGWARMAATEYHTMKQVLVETWTESPPRSPTLEEWLQSLRDDPGSWYDAVLPRRYAWHPNRTLRLFAEIHRAFARDVTRPCSDLPPGDDPSSASAQWSWLRFLAPNGAGWTVAMMGTENLRRYHIRRCMEDTRLSATQALLGLKAYQAHNGDLPPSLDALVPAYLQTIPRDAFDGRPLRYSPGKRLLYSVGADFVDSGGVTSNRSSKWVEPKWPLPF